MSRRFTQAVVSRRKGGENGVALILVLLLMVVLSTLAATLVFTARSETFASLSYRVDTEADYVAKAGIQAATNWFRSSRYQAVPNSQATAYYNVTADGSVWNLYTSNTAPVNCINSSSSKCPTLNAPVKLIGYGSGSSNYPADIVNGVANPVVADFQTSLQNVQVTGSSGNTGRFCVNAYLLNYQTVNCLTCAVNPAPMETWLITSLGTWGGTSCSSGTVATAEEQAIVQPIYTPTWANALYGYCSVTMGGSSGVCTDAFNSALGPYGGGNPSVASGGCDSSSPNVIDSGAGVGANGYVSLGSNVSISGDVTLGNIGYTPPSSCCTGGGCGYSGGGTVQGSVVNAPPAPMPSAPTFPTGAPISFPAGPPAAPSYSATADVPTPSSAIACPGGAGCPTGPFTPGVASPYTWPCMTFAVCNGTAANPYLIRNVSLTGGGSPTLTLYGGPDIFNPVHYDLDVLNESGQGMLTVNGFAVLNVRSTLSITGQGISNPLTNKPEALQINYAGTAAAALGGNGAMSAIVTAPNATVTLGGGGSKGYIVGAVRAANVDVQGGYPIHYDLQLNRLEGTMGQTVITSYARIKQ